MSDDQDDHTFTLLEFHPEDFSIRDAGTGKVIGWVDPVELFGFDPDRVGLG